MVLRGQSYSCVCVFAEFSVPQVMWGVLRVELPKSSIIMRIFPQSLGQQHGLSLRQCPIAEVWAHDVAGTAASSTLEVQSSLRGTSGVCAVASPRGNAARAECETLPHPFPPHRVPQAAVRDWGRAHHLGGLLSHPPQPEHLQPAGLLLPVSEMWWDCPHSGHHVPGQVWVAVCQGGSFHWQGPGDGDHSQLQQVRTTLSDHYWEQAPTNRELNYCYKERGV